MMKSMIKEKCQREMAKKAIVLVFPCVHEIIKCEFWFRSTFSFTWNWVYSMLSQNTTVCVMCTNKYGHYIGMHACGIHKTRHLWDLRVFGNPIGNEFASTPLKYYTTFNDNLYAFFFHKDLRCKTKENNGSSIKLYMYIKIF